MAKQDIAQKGVFPREGLVLETYRGLGGGIAREESHRELLREDSYHCAYCDGTGEGPPGVKCPVCRGSGSVTIFEPTAVKCVYCKGTGRRMRRAYITCVVCRGKGIVGVKEPIETCPACRGRSYHTSDKLPCTTCKGRGVVTVKERILR